MKLFVKLMIAVLVVALAAPFFIKGPDGSPLMQTSDLRSSLADARRSVSHQWRRITSRLGHRDGDPTTVYRWRDAAGNWVYSDEPNPAGASEPVTLDPHANVMDLPDTTSGSRLTSPGQATPDQTDSAGRGVPPILQPGKVEQLIEDVREIESDAAQRADEIEETR